MTNAEAIELVRELGHIFAVAVAEKTGKKVKSKSDLMNGLVAYDQLNLKGEREDLDKAVDKVLRIVYETVVEQIEADTIRIGSK
jgi:uncharacterized protein YutD